MTDVRAAKHIIDSFDEWHNDAMQNSLLSGDPEALNSFRKTARNANRDWRERFGYNERDDVNNVIQKILHKDVTPNEVANYLIGSGKIGKQGTTSRLYDGMMKATGNNPELAKSIQGAIWDTLSNSKNAAADIREFVHKSGRDLAQKVFPQGSRDLMLRHADTLDQADNARQVVAEVAKNTKPGSVPVEKGPMQQLAKQVIGGKVDKPEALWKTIEGYTKPGGDVGALAGLVRQLPPDMKSDISGAVVRGLGKDQSGNFSLDLFAKDWAKVTPQAKAVLFGNAGPHVQALNDLATIAQRMKDVKGKYGNPSGTGQTTAFHQMAATLGGAIIGRPFLAWGSNSGDRHCDRRQYRRAGIGIASWCGEHRQICQGAGKAGAVSDAGQPGAGVDDAAQSCQHHQDAWRVAGAVRISCAALARSGASRRTERTASARRGKVTATTGT